MKTVSCNYQSLAYIDEYVIINAAQCNLSLCNLIIHLQAFSWRSKDNHDGVSQPQDTRNCAESASAYTVRLMRITQWSA